MELPLVLLFRVYSTDRSILISGVLAPTILNNDKAKISEKG